METYRTDEEQVEAIKNWWQENGTQTLAIIGLSVTLIFGWQWWGNKQVADSSAASLAYQQLLDVLNTGNGKSDDVQLKTAKHIAGSLKDDHASSNYAQYAAMLLAKLAVDSADYEEAEAQLAWVLSNAEPSLASLAQLRLARVKFAAGKTDRALALIDGAQVGVYGASYEETKGDILLEKGEKQKSHAAYKAAMEIHTQQGTQPSPLLKMKMQGLAEPDESLIFDLPDFTATPAADSQESASTKQEG